MAHCSQKGTLMCCSKDYFELVCFESSFFSRISHFFHGWSTNFMVLYCNKLTKFLICPSPYVTEKIHVFPCNGLINLEIFLCNQSSNLAIFFLQTIGKFHDFSPSTNWWNSCFFPTRDGWWNFIRKRIESKKSNKGSWACEIFKKSHQAHKVV